MCGIYGTNIRYSEDILRSKMSSIDFRGPDASEISRFKDFHFGHRRLSIVDLDERSNQPFEYEHTVIVFNGEIYNHLKLRKILPSLNWKGSSDTETLLELIEYFGIDEALKKIEGMFAFALYDKKENKIFKTLSIEGLKFPSKSLNEKQNALGLAASLSDSSK